MKFPTKDQQLHHAYIVEGLSVQNKQLVFEYIEKRLNLASHNQDFFLIETGMFGVEDANRVVEINSRKAFEKGNKSIVIIADTFSHQAQNALLKTLEEPTYGTYFFILTSTASTFLPTVLSRVHVIQNNADNEHVDKDSTQEVSSNLLNTIVTPKKFIGLSKSERIQKIKEIIKEKENEKITDGDVVAFVGLLEREVFNMVKSTKKEIEHAKMFTIVSEYIRDTSSSKKMLLEYLALKIEA